MGNKIYWYGILFDSNDTDWASLGSYDVEEAKEIARLNTTDTVKPHIVIIDVSSEDNRCIGTIME